MYRRQVNLSALMTFLAPLQRQYNLWQLAIKWNELFPLFNSIPEARQIPSRYAIICKIHSIVINQRYNIICSKLIKDILIIIETHNVVISIF